MSLITFWSKDLAMSNLYNTFANVKKKQITI